MTDNSDSAIIILGGGGHASVVAEALRSAGQNVLGYTDRQLKDATLPGDVSCLGTDDCLGDHDPASVRLVLGIGSIKPSQERATLFEQLRARGYRFATVIHPSAIVAEDADLGEGVQIMAGAVVQPGCQIGDASIINTRASIDHDCRIGRYVHVAPGVTLSGGVELGDGCHVGTGAVIVQSVSVGADAFITAGAVVTTNVHDGARCGG